MNKVVHFEIPADDAERAQKFYKHVFGWKIDKDPNMPYWMLKTVECDEKNVPKEAGAINGGMYKREGDGATSPVVVMEVKSVEEHIKKVEEAGGKAVLPMREVGNYGFYAQVKDTEDNIIGLWQTKK